MTLWKRTQYDEDVQEKVEQFIEDRDGELFGWEVYENGVKSDEVALLTRTLPLGFQRSEQVPA